MKKHFVTGIILTLLMILAIPASTVYAEGNTVYLKTAAVPKAASEYANKMFSGLTKSDLTSLGLTSSEAKAAVLANGFCAKAADENVDTENTFYFPILCSGKITAMMTVTSSGTAYGYQIGKDNMSDALNVLTTSPDNAAEIYVSGSAFYGVTFDDVTVLSYGLSYKEITIKKEADFLKSKRKNSVSANDIVVVYGNKTTGTITENGKLYYIKSGISQGAYTGWAKKGSKRFYYIDGVKRKGWTYIYDKNNWYYFDKSDGSLATGTLEIDGTEFTFASDGAWEGKTNIGSASAYSALTKKLSKKDYGGIYFDQSSVVVLSVNDKKVQKAIDEVKKDFPQITLKHCKYSVKELESVYNYLGDKMHYYEIMGLSTDVMNNCILVQMEKSSPELEEYIDSLENSDIIHIEYGDFRLIDD